jgi:hypothetical protein
MLWLIKGDHDAPGWQALREDVQEEKIDVVHLDPRVWAVVAADEPPAGYDGLEAVEPADGIYVDPQGNPLYLVACQMVAGPREVIAALGDEAESLLDRVKDPDRVLELLGRAF